MTTTARLPLLRTPGEALLLQHIGAFVTHHHAESEYAVRASGCLARLSGRLHLSAHLPDSTGAPLYIREGFSNDFAHWALTACNEPGLAEQLASVDVREFTSLGELRERFVQVIEKHLQLNPADGQHMEETFYFCAADIVVMPTKFVAETMQDFVKGLRR
jgi:Family of unknown function (DUF5752)